MTSGYRNNDPKQGVIVVVAYVLDSCAHPEQQTIVTIHDEPSTTGAVSMTDFDITTGDITYQTAGGDAETFNLSSRQFGE